MCLDGWVPVCGCGGVDGWVGACVCIEIGGDICKISVPPTLYWEPKTTQKNEVFLILFQNARALNQNQEFQGRKEEDQETQNEKQSFKRCQ